MNRFSTITRIAIGILFLAAIILAVWWLFFFKRPSEETTPVSFPSSPDTAKRQTEETPRDTRAERTRQTVSYQSDTDGDGIPDFEEALWGTNPQSADSDNDGISDAEEIRRLRAGEEVPTHIPPAPHAAAPTAPTKTETPEQETGTRPELRLLPPAAPPTVSPIRSLSPETFALRAYAATAGIVIQSYASRWQSEFDSFESFATTTTANPTEAAKDLRRVADEYRARADALARSIPPAVVQPLHTELVAHYRDQAAAIEMLASRGDFNNVSQDDWNMYADAVVAAGQAYYKLSEFLSNKNAPLYGSSF